MTVDNDTIIVTLAARVPADLSPESTMSEAAAPHAIALVNAPILNNVCHLLTAELGGDERL
jgi:hypothetical protein